MEVTESVLLWSIHRKTFFSLFCTSIQIIGYRPRNRYGSTNHKCKGPFFHSSFCFELLDWNHLICLFRMCVNEVKSQDQYCFIQLGLIREKKTNKNPKLAIPYIVIERMFLPCWYWLTSKEECTRQILWNNGQTNIRVAD